MSKEIPELYQIDHDSSNFFNRELSWLEFNARVLGEALDKNTPLLERLKFLSIFTSNLDEFFMVRIAGLKKMKQEGFSQCESPDSSSISSIFKKVHERTSQLITEQFNCLNKQVLPKLRDYGIRIHDYKSLSKKQKDNLTDYFKTKVFPVLTPLAVDSSHPFPFLTNLSTYILVEFSIKNINKEQEPIIGFVEIPSILPRLIPVDDGPKKEVRDYLLLEDLIEEHMNFLFLGFYQSRCVTVRVTRNLDYNLLEDNVVDLLESVQKEVLKRKHQEAVRLEIGGDLSDEILLKLLDELRLQEIDIYKTSGIINIPSLMALYDLPIEEIKDPEFNPCIPSRVAEKSDIFSVIRDRDLLVHHPYESFHVVLKFLAEAADDPDVLAIKQTLYRSSGDSSVIDLLVKASENGKHVTAVVELKARFDEKNNIVWARRLERSGVNVVYGFVGLKTHCKLCLVVRSEEKKMKRYLHLSTGNYNAKTSKIYCDLGLFTCNQELCEDASSVFNLLTGFNTFSRKRINTGATWVPNFNKFSVAPINLRESIISNIIKVVKSHKKNKDGSITIKINGLIDKSIINHLYYASQVGVKIKLIVRGICCLIPGKKGLSENIEVVSIVDRFLEHSRVYCFKTSQETKIFIGSADMMARSMDRRIEIIYPITDEQIKQRIEKEIIEVYLLDNIKSHRLKSDGKYYRIKQKVQEESIRSQKEFIRIARNDFNAFENSTKFNIKKSK